VVKLHRILRTRLQNLISNGPKNFVFDEEVCYQKMSRSGICMKTYTTNKQKEKISDNSALSHQTEQQAKGPIAQP
jgi:hypothetical protein